MKEIFRIIISGSPVAKQADRSRYVKPKNKPKGYIQHYQKKKVVNWQAYVKGEVAKAWGDKPLLDEPLILEIIALFTPPKGLRAAQKRHLKENGWIPKSTNPDCGNIEKPISDALQGVVVINDSRFYDTRVIKWYALKPGVIISIRSL